MFLNSHWGWGYVWFLPKWVGTAVPGKKRWFVLCLENFGDQEIKAQGYFKKNKKLFTFN